MLPESVTINHPDRPSVSDTTTPEMIDSSGEHSHEFVMEKGISDDLKKMPDGYRDDNWWCIAVESVRRLSPNDGE
ncbi:hypothetical protein P4S72_02365 [Vibrio sp. PP-XX7]